MKQNRSHFYFRVAASKSSVARLRSVPPRFDRRFEIEAMETRSLLSGTVSTIYTSPTTASYSLGAPAEDRFGNIYAILRPDLTQNFHIIKVAAISKAVSVIADVPFGINTLTSDREGNLYGACYTENANVFRLPANATSAASMQLYNSFNALGSADIHSSAVTNAAR